jgi:hypothetical protein
MVRRFEQMTKINVGMEPCHDIIILSSQGKVMVRKLSPMCSSQYDSIIRQISPFPLTLLHGRSPLHGRQPHVHRSSRSRRTVFTSSFPNPPDPRLVTASKASSQLSPCPPRTSFTALSTSCLLAPRSLPATSNRAQGPSALAREVLKAT